MIVPEGWRAPALADLLVVQPNRKLVQQGWSPQCLASPAPAHAWGVLKTTAIQAGWFDDTQHKELPDGLAPRPAIEVKVGDLLITCAGPRARCGIPALVRSTRPRLMMSGKMYRFRPEPQLDAKYLEFWLLSPEAQRRIDRMKTGISDSGLNLTHSRFLQLPVPYPELLEQRRIVAILEERISDLEGGMRSLRKAEARCSLLKRSVLLDLIPEPADWPTRWRSETVSAVGSVELGRQRHPDWHHGSNMRPYLRVANVFEDRIDTSDVMEMHWPEDTFERFKLRPGQILLNEGQSPQYLGRPAMYRGEPADVAFTNSLLRFTAGPDALPEFALLVFRRHMHAGRFAKESRITTNIAHLSASRLKGIEFPVPPLAEQKDLVNLARERLEAVSRIEGSIQAQMRRSAGLRRAVLAAAFSGRLTGHSSDTNVVEELAEEESA